VATGQEQPPANGTAENAVTEQPPVEDLLIDLDADIGRWLPDALQPFWAFLQDHPWLLVLILAALGYVIGKGLQWGLRQLLERITKRTKSDLDDRLIRYLTKPVVQTTVILALVAAVKSFGFDESSDRFMVRVLYSALLLLWGRAWFHAVTMVISMMARDAQRFPAFQPRTRPLFEMGVKLVLLSVFIWLFMVLWDIDGTAWLASAGVVGIAVGFAAKDTLANLISGVSIIADAPYKIGDYIVLDTGERVLQAERDRGRLEMHWQDVPLALARQHDFLCHVVRADGRWRHHQQQHLGALEGADDGLAPQRGAVDAALVDPDIHTGGPQLAREIEHACFVLARVAQEYVCRLRQCRGLLGPVSSGASGACLAAMPGCQG